MGKFLICISALFIISACRKNNQKFLSQSSNPSPAGMVIENGNMSNYLVYEGELEMTRLNKRIYSYLKGMQYVFSRNPAKLEHFYDKIKVNFHNGLFLTSYINGSGNCTNDFNSYVRSQLPDPDPEKNYSLTLATGMTIMDKLYVPTVSLYNAENAELDDEYYMALLVEDKDMLGHSESKEYIPALHVTSNGVIFEMIEYFDSYFQNIPVFVFAYEVAQDYEIAQGTILAPIPNEIDTETYHIGVQGVPFSPPVMPGEGRGGTNPPVVIPPAPKSFVYTESINLYAHHEQYGASEYALIWRVDDINNGMGWVYDRTIANVPRNVVDCGCYYYLGSAFIFSDDFNTSSTYFFVTYEFDGWATKKDFAFQGGGGLVPLKMSRLTDVYVTSNTIFDNMQTDYPNATSGKSFTNGPGIHLLRRKVN